MVSNKEKALLDFIVYQIYPRSFYDSNGDGIGDLAGISQKQAHLQNLGVNAVWICPCYPSPNADNGYDVSDYKNINPLFGNMRDFELLQSRFHKAGIKIIMDFVANHTSDEHFFFQEAQKSRDNPYHSYYIWQEKPNRWKSVFGGSAWEYNPSTNEYYLHSFDKKQPDLNWQNKQVRKEMQSVIDFWIDKGVDGFRCDVLDFIAKDFEKGKQFGGEKLPDYIQELFGRKNTRSLFTIGECQADEKSICDICGLENGKLSTVFQFDHIRVHGNDKFRPKKFSFQKLKKTLVKWQNFAQKRGIVLALFTDNHDYPYLLSRHGEKESMRYFCATFYATAVFLLRGIPFIYQSQEYGAINPYYERIDDFNDVETKNRYEMLLKQTSDKKAIEEINVGSRDNARRPFAWNSDKKTHYGFSTATPWIAPHSKANKINLEKDKNAEDSVFRFYQQLFSLRKEHECLRYGKFINLSKKKNTFVYERVYKNNSVIIVCNYDKAQKLALVEKLRQSGYVLALNNYKARQNEPFSTVFQPFETAVYIR